MHGAVEPLGTEKLWGRKGPVESGQALPVVGKATVLLFLLKCLPAF